MSKFVKVLLVLMVVFYLSACLLPYAEAAVAKDGCDGGHCPLPPNDDEDCGDDRCGGHCPPSDDNGDDDGCGGCGGDSCGDCNG